MNGARVFQPANGGRTFLSAITLNAAGWKTRPLFQLPLAAQSCSRWPLCMRECGLGRFVFGGAGHATPASALHKHRTCLQEIYAAKVGCEHGFR